MATRRNKSNDDESQGTPPAGNPAECSHANSWAETCNFHSEDLYLRQHGYKIEHRRKGEEAIWSLAGQHYTQSQALKLCGWQKPILAAAA